MTFSFLHISDIHFGDESTSSREFKKNIVKKINDEHLGADCLVISGDLFNRGSLDRLELEAYGNFLGQLPGRECTIVVPGNHDLDRSAQQKKDGSFNVFTSRRNIVLNKGNIVMEANGEFELLDNEKPILYEMAFRAFHSFSREMNFRSFCTENPALSIDNYEVQVVDLPFGDEGTYKVRFVLLNTALIAGQSVRGNDFRNRQRKLEEMYQRALHDGDLVNATEINSKIAKLQRRFEDDGELIIDEEIASESGRLSLSRNGNQRLSSIQSDGAVLTIFVGHHGFQYLAQETQEALKTAMKSCGSGIYLCGHAHQARYRRFILQQNSYPRDVEQIQAGVMFKDETNFAQYGFNSASFFVDLEESILRGTISSYFLVKSASQELRWLKEDIDFNFNLPKSNSAQKEKDNTHKPDRIPNIMSEPSSKGSESLPPRQGPALTSGIRLSAQDST